MEQPHNRHTSGAQPSLQHNGGPPPYGSTFRPEPPSNKQPTNNSITTPTPPQPVRGGVQVLPPVVPPRAPVKTKPKPPVPPKRDQLTRLTTVKKDPIPIHRDDKDEAKSLEALEKKINETSSEPQERTFSETIEHFERQGSFAQKKKVANYENTAQLDQPVYASINPETKKLHNSESKVSLKSEGEPSKESSSEEESGATADIWVRAIDSPVKKTEKVFRSNSAIEESPVDKPIATHRTSIDNSQLTRTPVKPDKPEIIVEKDVEDDRNCKAGTESLPCSRPSSRATSRSSSPANFTDKEKKKISAAEALGVIAKPCPRPPPGKRIKNQLEFRRQSLGNLSDSKLSMGCSTSCPSHQLWSSFGECQEADYKRHERSRGQSADSRTLQRLKTDSWETQSYSSTLSRIGKYSTSKYFAKTSTCPAATTVSSPSPTVSCQERPKSTCNCGRHSTVPTNCPAVIVPKDVGKRTFSVEELRSGGFIRGSNTTGSTRGSFGKSPRVTFALSEDEMGATGPTSPPKYDPGDPRRVSVRARSYDADDRAQSNRSQPAIGLKQTPKARVMDDSEIQETVESILGKGARVVDCEKKSTIREEEVLLVNGCPIRLEGAEGAVIRDALLHGTAPHSDILNQILIRAGILSAPVRLETSLSVKSTVVTREQVTVARGGRVIDGRSRETKEDNYYSSTTSEVWEPSGTSGADISINPVPSSDDTSSLTSVTKDDKFFSTSSSSNTERSSITEEDSPSSSVDDFLGHDVTDRISGMHINGFQPTIFGTVASDQTPKDSTTCRRSLPQTTPPGISNGSEVHATVEPNSSHDNSVMYREGNLVSGKLEALIQHMVPTADYYPDRAFLFAFLLTSRLFIKPHDLLGQILAFSEAQLKAKQATTKERGQLLARFVQLLGEWSETFPYDFRDERVMSHVRDVAHRCVSVEGPVRQEVSLLLHNLLYRLKKLEQYEAFLHSIHTEATTTSIEALSQTEVSEVCGSAVSLAQQLTHIELERLSYIGPEEFVQAFAKESPTLETSFKDMKQTRNLESYVSWFNRLSYFVATEVCKHIKSKKQRVRVVEFWVETARECFNIGNFNSLMAIIAGLNMSPVSRLKRTWSKVQCAKFSVLEHQMDPSCNFSSYRSTLKAAVWRSAAATDDSQRIVIPFFSLLVKDLYFLNEGCSNRLPNGHINFEKFWQLAKQVTEFITWKQVHCPFPKAAKVITYLQATPVLNEDALSLASFECEPPENHEKDRYKALKAELGNSTSGN